MERHTRTFERFGRIALPHHAAPLIGARAVAGHAGVGTIAATCGAVRLTSPTASPEQRNRAQAISRSFVHVACLALVWLAVATSGLVFSEPAPTDTLAIGLVVLLPVVGLVAISPMLTGYLALWLVTAACGFLAATVAPEIGDPTKFTAVSTYLYVSSFVIAAFVARNARAHTVLIFNAWSVAALAAAAAGLVGYFELLPGAFDLFTRFGRAAGTFKDPNVFGPFLVAPFLYALHMVIERPWHRIALPLAIAGILALGVFLSFSRGAWFTLATALVTYGWLSFVTTSCLARRLRILQLIATGTLLVGVVVLGALQNDRIGDLLSQRANLTQSYDVGPEGRFGGQEKAIGLILENPLGIGATVFASVHHHEEVHNVYLSMMLNAGWLGGGLFLLMIGLTVVLGLRHAFVGSQSNSMTQPLFLIAYAAFLANALEGFIIDLDHWRHVYLLMALVWGLMSADSRQSQARHARQV